MPRTIIYETDMTYDVDDVGALALLHVLADAGEVELLAIGFNETHPSGVGAIRAINGWYGRADIPVGAFRGHLEAPDESRYLSHVAGMQGDPAPRPPPDALDLYRTTLSAQPDGSVTIVSVGFLNTLAGLLRADEALIRAKVRQLVVMGGRHDDGFNLVRHDLVATSEFILRNWPTPLALSDFGGHVRTGAVLESAPTDNPVREAWYRYFGESFRGRSSWDEVAVLYGAWGEGEWFEDVAQGEASLPNGYVWQLEAPRRTYVGVRKSGEAFAALIDGLMLQPPARR